jgi:hypothetical protein
MEKSIENQILDNIDRPERHNINPANRPTRNEDPLSPRNKLNVDFPESDENTLCAYNSFGFKTKLTLELGYIKNMLLEKNRKYGNSALEPTRIFSSADAIEQIKVRIDDKLSRLKNKQDDDNEDVIDDLIGYLLLLKIANKTKEGKAND